MTPNLSPNTPSLLALFDASHHGKIMVEGSTAARLLYGAWETPELRIGAGAEAGPGQVYRLRSDLFLVHTPPRARAETSHFLHACAREAAGLVTVTDVTDGRLELRLRGASAASLLSRLCGLDFSAVAFPNLSARFTSLAKTRQLLARRDEDGALCFAIIGGRSLGDYVRATMIQAGYDLGMVAPMQDE